MISPAFEGFWSEWFGDYLGRGVGNPTRDFIESPENFVRWTKRNEESNIRSYVSVQPFKAYEKPVCIEKLFFDFDCEEDPKKAGDDAFEFKKRLKKFYNVKTIPIFSGNKGYHIYPFLAKNFGYGLTHAQLRDVYKKLMEMLVGSARARPGQDHHRASYTQLLGFYYPQLRPLTATWAHKSITRSR